MEREVLFTSREVVEILGRKALERIGCDPREAARVKLRPEFLGGTIVAITVVVTPLAPTLNPEAK